MDPPWLDGPWWWYEQDREAEGREVTNHLKDNSLGVLERRLAWQEADHPRKSYSMGVCGHPARGGYTCSKCLRAEIERRKKEAKHGE
jgi:hypothetical protein